MNTNSFIENVLPDGVKFEDLPEIKHQNKFVGYTDYLDSIYPDYLTHYVMRGIDQYNRKYIVVYHKNNIQTYFQRYSNSTFVWSFGTFQGGEYCDLILQGCCNIAKQPDSIKKIKNVIETKLKSNHIPKNMQMLELEKMEPLPYPVLQKMQ